MQLLRNDVLFQLKKQNLLTILNSIFDIANICVQICFHHDNEFAWITSPHNGGVDMMTDLAQCHS